MFVRISNQESKKATRSNKNKFARKQVIAKSNNSFLVIDSRDLSKQEHSKFDNNLQNRNELETNTSSIYNNNKIDYKIVLKKRKEKIKQFVVKRKYQLLLRENQNLQVLLQNNKVSVLSMR